MYSSIDYVVNRISIDIRSVGSSGSSLLDFVFGSTSRILDKEILNHK
jgi:hypothetical protein